MRLMQFVFELVSRIGFGPTGSLDRPVIIAMSSDVKNQKNCSMCCYALVSSKLLLTCRTWSGLPGSRCVNGV